VVDQPVQSERRGKAHDRRSAHREPIQCPTCFSLRVQRVARLSDVIACCCVDCNHEFDYVIPVR
jgi:hypothetical protein